MERSLKSELDRTSPVPLHHQLKELIKQEITSGLLPIGTRVPSEREICGIYGVSRVTATRAMTDLANEGFLEKQVGRGTFVADPGSSDEKSCVLGIGLYETHYLIRPFFSTIIAGVMEVACAEGYQLQVIVTEDVAETSKAPLYDRMLEQRKVDGMILIDHAVSDADLIDFHSHGVPVVLFDRVVNGHDFYSVLVDSRGGAFQLVEHLRSLGHKDIGFVTPGFQLPPARDRYEGYRSALSVCGLDFRPDWVFDLEGKYDGEAFDAAIARIMRLDPRPTALIFHEDYIAISAASALHKLGYRIPQDISITGFDNIPQSSISLPTITTIDSGLLDMGRDMANAVLSQIRHEQLQNKCRIAPSRIIVRDSTGSVPNSGTADVPKADSEPASKIVHSTKI